MKWITEPLFTERNVTSWAISWPHSITASVCATSKLSLVENKAVRISLGLGSQFPSCPTRTRSLPERMGKRIRYRKEKLQYDNHRDEERLTSRNAWRKSEGQV